MKFTKKLLLLQIFVFLLATTTKAQESNWKIDPAYSKIGFNIPYFKVSDIQGVFDDYAGTFIINGDDLTTTKVNIVIKTTSINTNQKKRDNHLRTDEFFSAEKHPEITFTSTSVKKISDEKYELTGDFTMRGITKSITLKLEYKGSFTHPRFKNKLKFFNVTGVIQREDFEVATKYPPAEFALGKGVELNAVLQVILEK